MKKLTSAIVASSLVLGLVGTVGATTPDKVQTASDRMLKLGLINGVTPGTTDLALSANLTRAQLVTILVRAFGQEANARYLNGAAAFPDTANHIWASGYIAMAKRIISERTSGKEVVGMPDGTFNPDGNVTAAEAVAFLMKFVGAPKDDTLAWPDNYIVGAAKAGLITAEDKAVLDGVKNAPATRGLAFYLADRTFYGYKLVEGGTTYTTFVDNVKPVLTVDATPATTLEEQVIITGTVPADVVSVHVGNMDNAATVANGKFTATVKLTVGENKILVHAVDLAGNASEQIVTVTKTVGTAASIDAADVTVGAGEAVDLKAAVKDAKGNAIADAVITGESTIGTFAAGKFTAGEKAGEGTLTLKSGELTKSVKVTITAGVMTTVTGDKPSVAPGKQLTLLGKDKFGNTVTGVTFAKVTDGAIVDGNTFIATKAGTYTVKGTKGDVSVEGKIGVFGDVAKLVASTSATVVANNATEIEVAVSAVDEAGNINADYTGEIVVYNSDLDQSDTVKVETVNGTAKFHFTALSTWAGSVAELNFHDVDNTDIKGTTTIEVVAQKATSIKLAAPEYLPTNGGADYSDVVTVTILDQAGEEMTDGSWDFAVKLTGPANLENGTKTDTVTLANGDTIVVIPESAGDTGNVDISVTASGLTSAKATIKAAFAKAAAALSLKASATSKVVADAATANNDSTGLTPNDVDRRFFTFTAKVTDKAGVPVIGAGNGMQVHFEGVADTTRVFFSTSKDAGSFVPVGTSNINVTPDVNGVVTFYVLGTVADDSFKVSVIDPTGKLTSSQAVDVALKADSPFTVGFEGDSLNLKKAKVATGDLTAQLYDQFGNKATVAGVKVDFDADSYNGVKLNGSSKLVSVRTDANGQAKVSVALTAANTTTANITVSGQWNGENMTPVGDLDETTFHGTIHESSFIAMKSELPESITGNFVALDGKRISTYALADTVTPGTVDGFQMKIVIKDDLGAGVTGLVNSDFKVTASSSKAVTNAQVTESNITADEVGTYYVEGIAPTTAGTLTVDVKLVNYTGKNTISKAIAIKAGAAADFELAEASAFGSYDGKILVESNKATAFTVQLLDKWGNAVSTNNSAGEDVTITATQQGIKKGTENTTRVPGFLDIRDVDGAPISGITIKSSRTNGKFYVLTNAVDAELSITLGGVTYNYSVNPTTVSNPS